MVQIVIMLLLMPSCHRRPLVDEMPDRVAVPISILWKEAGVIPQNVSVLFYDQSGDLYMEHLFENQGDIATSKVHLPIGKYTVVVFNEKRDQIDYVRVRGYQKLETLEAYVTKANTIYEVKGRAAEENTIVNHPGELATIIATIDISPELLKQFNMGEITSPHLLEQINGLTNLVPIIRTVNVEVTISVEALHNARMPALAELHNMAGGYLMGQNLNTMTPVMSQFMVDNRVYHEGSVRDGQISATITSMGVMGNQHSANDSQEHGIHLHTFFQLVDKDRTVVEHRWDVTEAIEFHAGDKQTIYKLKLDVSTPTPLPDVKPEGGSDSGMSSEVVDWEYVDVPIEM